ncbi:MAG TPA: hypothetical protein VMT35_00610 [Ignavibacteriaceae bacterium]|nr:hypothetical protein [Ignavibacteriaceae bacterium]
MNNREKEIRKAQKLLTDVQLLAFFKAAGNRSNVSALKIINEYMDSGEQLDSIFYSNEKDESYFSGGFFLNIKKTSTIPYKISFGFSAGDAGDGGEWEVTFDREKIKSITEGLWWIA